VLTDILASLDPGGPAGLAQRVSIVIGWSWVAAVAIR
jgi:hypothetical protein